MTQLQKHSVLVAMWLNLQSALCRELRRLELSSILVSSLRAATHQPHQPWHISVALHVQFLFEL